MTDGERPEVIWGEVVTGNYFSGLGLHPVVGRGFLPDEDQAPGAKAVCVLNYNFWRNRFHGDPDIAGKTIRMRTIRSPSSASLRADSSERTCSTLFRMFGFR